MPDYINRDKVIEKILKLQGCGSTVKDCKHEQCCSEVMTIMSVPTAFKTYAQDYFEKHPDARFVQKDGKKIPYVCREAVYGSTINRHSCCSNYVCPLCWDEVMEEQ